MTRPSNKEEKITGMREAAGLKISLALVAIVIGLIGLIAYQLFRIPIPADREHAGEARSATSDRSSTLNEPPSRTTGGSFTRRDLVVELNLIKPSSDLPPLRLSEGDDRSSGGRQAGMEENQAAVEQFQAGRYEAAAALLGKAHELDPTNPVFTKNLAYAKARIAWNQVDQAEYETALTGFQSAITLQSQEFSFYFGLGVSYHRLKKEAQAKEAAEKALRLAPNESAPYKLLGEIAYQNDQLDEALGYFEKALQLVPRDPNLPSVIEKLQREHQVQSQFQQEATIHFTVKFEGHEERDVADQVVRILEEAYGDIGKSFSYYPESPITVILYSDQQFRDITRTPAWTGGLFDGKIRIPTEGAGFSPEVLNRVLHHEYTHAIVYALTDGHVPTWLNEGLALNFEKGDPASSSSVSSSAWDSPIQGAIRTNSLISLQALHGSFMNMDEATSRLSYAESYSAVKYLIDRYGMFAIQSLLKDLSRQRDFDKAFEDRFFISYQEFQTAWQKGLAP
ncbi:MAG TPA: tetratricopeptide repeat protein [Nitrospiria bacterium]|nr:tetratricopeptide repeat protein [Nitrospiria bacterium]